MIVTKRDLVVIGGLAGAYLGLVLQKNINDIPDVETYTHKAANIAQLKSTLTVDKYESLTKAIESGKPITVPLKFQDAAKAIKNAGKERVGVVADSLIAAFTKSKI